MPVVLIPAVLVDQFSPVRELVNKEQLENLRKAKREVSIIANVGEEYKVRPKLGSEYTGIVPEGYFFVAIQKQKIGKERE